MAENVLVMRLSALGDIVLFTGHFKAIRARHPQAHLALMTRGAFADFCRSMGIFDEIVVDNRTELDPREWWRICKKTLADRRWDVVYDLHGKGRTFRRYYPLARFLTRHPMTWVRILRTGGFLVYRSPKKLPFTWRRPTCEPFAFEAQPPDLSFCHGDHRHFGLLPARYVLAIPGCSAGHPYKKWPAERFRALSERCAAHGLKTVVMGTRAEAAEIGAVARDNPDAVDFMGRSSLADIPDLARGAAFVVGNDTGPSHMARIAGAKTVTLFCRITEKSAREAPNAVNVIRDAIADISVDDVLAAARQLGVAI